MKNKQVMNRQTSSKELHLISCGWEKCTPEQSYGPGIRRYYTIHFVLSGQGYFYMNNRKYTLKAGQCFFIPPMTSSLYKWLDLTRFQRIKLITEQKQNCCRYEQIEILNRNGSASN